jgi:hypothetical protein
VSASVNGSAREAQIHFVEALLAGLGPKDRFNLLTADSEVRWAFEQPSAANPVAVEEALAFVEARRPLGWSDLDAAFGSALQRTKPTTHVVYVGDGAVTTGDADPVAFAARLRKLFQGRGNFHAVQPGSGGESAVLNAIAGLGSGSERSIGGGSDPAGVANTLLAEIVSPKLENVEVSFNGFATAAVYPRRLPNLPLGTQQVLVGRFQPQGKVEGKVVVRARFGGKPYLAETAVAFETKPGDGNSFVPRLWARRHLDALLEQGRTDQTKRRVIALSEDFQIITPYTSFLVLESDADRERFNVKKRFRMRDGEEFFAKGQDNARYALRRQQLLAAKKWRVKLRANLLKGMTDLNRNLVDLLRRANAGQIQLAAQGKALAVANAAPVGGGWGGDKRGRSRQMLGKKESAKTDTRSLELGDAKGGDMDGFAQDAPGAPPPARSPMPKPAESMPEGEAMEADEEMARSSSALRMESKSKRRRGGRFNRRDRGLRAQVSQGLAKGGFLTLKNDRPAPPWNGLLALFPNVPNPRQSAAKPPLWEGDAKGWLLALDRRPWLAKLGKTLEIVTKASHTDLRQRRHPGGSGRALLAKGAWATQGRHVAGNQVRYDWLENGKRGALTEAWLLGRQRPARAGDELDFPSQLAWLLGSELRSYAGYTARITQRPGTKPIAVIRLEPRPQTQRHHGYYRRLPTIVELRCDVTRNVVLGVKWLRGEVVTTENRFSEFTQIAGAWFPGKKVLINAKGRTTWTSTWAYRLLEPAAATAERAKLLAPRAKSTVLGELPSLALARQAVEGGKPSLEQRLVALGPPVGAQKWDKADPQAAALFAALKGTLAGDALRARYLSQRRRNEELKAHLQVLARGLGQPRPGDLYAARSVFSWAANALHRGQETITLLEGVKPVFARQKTLEPLWPWEVRLVQAMVYTSSPEATLAKRKELAKRYPFQVQAHRGYANALFQRGEVEASLALLRAALQNNTPWDDHEVYGLREEIATQLWNDVRYTELVKQVDAWDAVEVGKPLGPHHYNRVLSALVMLDRTDEADERMKAWCQAVTNKRAVDERSWSRLRGTVSHCLGDSQGYSPQWIVPQRAKLLAEVALALSASGAAPNSPAHVSPDAAVQQILTHWRFRRNDASKAVIAGIYGRLEQGVETLTVERVARLAEWISQVGYRPAKKTKGWKQLWQRIYTRWTKETDAGQALALSGLIARYGGRDLNLARLRRELSLTQEPSAERSLRGELLTLIRQGKWSPAAEKEARATFLALGPLKSETGEAREVSINDWIASLHDLTAWIANAQATAKLAALPEHNDLDRRQLKSRREGLLKVTRGGLRAALTQTAQAWPEALRPHMELEALWLGTKLRQAPGPMLVGSRRLLKLAIDSASSAGASAARDLRWRVVASRAVATQIVLLADAPEDVKAKSLPPLRALVDQALAKANKLLDWKQIYYSLLLATNEIEGLRARLLKWFGDGKEVDQRRWGRALAFIHAERGELKPAVGVLEKLRDELSFDEWNRLADLYMCLDRRADSAKAKLSSWEQLNEWRLNSGLNTEFYKRYQRRGKRVPEQLRPDVPVRFVALLKKARRPQRYVWLVRQYYSTTRDFRLLACVPEATQGQSSQGVYELLTGFNQVCQLLQEEATLDRLTKHLGVLAKAAKTTLDRRALDLLEYMVARRAAEQSQGASPHVQRSLQALQRAFAAASWEKGEKVHYASYLSQQGRVRSAPLAAEQVRQLRHLLAETAVKHEDHLTLSIHLARALWNYGQRDEALQTLEASMNAARDAGGRLPASAASGFNLWISYLEGVRAYRRGEALLNKEIRLARNPNQRQNLRQRLDQFYVGCLRQGGEVSLGREQALYEALRDRIWARMTKARNEHAASRVVNAACTLFQTRAHYRQGRRLQRRQRPEGVRSIAKDLKLTAFNRLPKTLNRFRYRQGQNMVSQLANSLQNLLGGLTALEFLVTRGESEPRWLRLCGWDFWSQHGWRFARSRHKAGNLPPALRTRALALVIDALREDLREGRSRNRSVYDQRNSHFWNSARGDFHTTAQEVLSKHGLEEPVLLRVADYLFRGLNERREAIKALADRHAGGQLSRGGRVTLVVYLRESSRHVEAIPVLEQLITERPDGLQHRLWLVESAYHAGKSALSESALLAALKLLKEGKRWHEHAIAQVARTCVVTHRSQRAAELWQEAINLHTRGRSNRGIADGTLGGYYQALAQAHAQLGNTVAAVDAAAGGVIAWGSNRHQRGLALHRLHAVLSAAKDLGAYVKHLDGEVAKSGLENPLLRKTIAKVYQGRREFKRAAEQLELSVEAQPNDAETHRMLITVYDSLGQAQRAADQLLAMARVRGHTPQLYVELGDRYARANQPAMAERAYTTLVEMQPNEAAAQRALAGVREKQGHLDDAAIHWRQVIRVRSDEPGGVIGLAKVLLRLGKRAEAAEQIEKLRRTDWPDRFDDSVRQALRNLQRFVPKKKPGSGEF